MITAFLLNLLLCSLGEDKDAPSAATDGGTPVIVVHLDGRRFAGFLSDLEADPLSVLLLDSTTTIHSFPTRRSSDNRKSVV